MFKWVKIFSGFPHVARNLNSVFYSFSTYPSHWEGTKTRGLLDNQPACSVREHQPMIVVQVFSCFDVSLLGQPILPSLRGWWEKWVKWFTRKISEGGFRWSMSSVKSEVTKRSDWKTAFQKATMGWIGLFLFHPRGNCPSRCIACNISGCLDYIQTHIYCALSSEWPWPS